MNKTEKIISDLVKKSLKPPPKLTLAEFAEARFRLSAENSAEAGRYYISRAEYQRGMLNAVTDPRYQEIVFCLSSQTGKTTINLIALLFYMSEEPSPILLVTPSEAMAKSVSKDRLNPALRDCVGFDKLLKENTSKESTNNILSKSFVGGNLNIIGSGSAAQLASRPIRVCLLDECDRFDGDAGGEGHAAELAKRRTANFYNRKLIYNATPTDIKTSYIWQKFLNSNQSYYHIKCPHCEDTFVPEWEHVRWIKDEITEEHKPHTALLYCPKCGTGLNDTDRNQAVRNGHWEAKFPKREVAGFHVSALHSPWANMKDLVTSWIEAQGNIAALKVFKNTVLGLPWEPATQDIDDAALVDHYRDIGLCNIPDDVTVLTSGVDTQNDRFESVLVGHGDNGRKYILDYQIFHGDPNTQAPQIELKNYLTSVFPRADGTKLLIAATVIDSGGTATQSVYKFTKDNAKYRIYAGKGAAGNRPAFPATASQTNLGKFYLIGIESIKEQFYSQLRIENPEEHGYIFISEKFGPDRLDQLTAEHKILKMRNGRHYWAWEKKSEEKPNEMLDCYVYANAAFESLNIDINTVSKYINSIRKNVIKQEQTEIETPKNIEIKTDIEDTPAQPIKPKTPTPRVHRKGALSRSFNTAY